MSVWKQVCYFVHAEVGRIGRGCDNPGIFCEIMQFNHVPMLFVKCESNFLSKNSTFHTHIENELKNPGAVPIFQNSDSIW